MKNLVFASAALSACIGLVPMHLMQAQNGAQSQAPDSITIADKVEYNTWQNAIGQTDPKARAAALEAFLTTYPQTVARNLALDQLEDLYQNLAQQAQAAAAAATADKQAQAKALREAAEFTAKELDAATRLLAVVPDNLKALYVAATIERSQGATAKPTNLKLLADAADKARHGLKVAKPADVSDADWQKITASAYPAFHSAVATEAFANNHFDAAVAEYVDELKLDPIDATKSGLGLSDTYQLATAYSQEDPKDEVKSIWFLTRVWSFAPSDSTNVKGQLAQQLEYKYRKYHGSLDGLGDIKTQAANSVFPPDGFTIKPAPTLAELIHQEMEKSGGIGPNLHDQETVLAAGFQEDADKVWASLKDQTIPVPGTLIAATASELKVSIVEAGKTPSQSKTTDYLVKLQNPLACGDLKSTTLGVKALEDLILRNGFKEDTDRLAKVFSDNSAAIRRIVLDPSVSTLAVAVTPEAKKASAADFIVNLKSPTACKALPAPGSDFDAHAGPELIGTYDSYTKVAATDKTDASVQLILRDGVLQQEKKHTAPRKQAAPTRKSTHS